MANKYIVIQKINETDTNMWGTTGEHPRLLLKNSHSRNKSTDTTGFSDVTRSHCFTNLKNAEKVLRFLQDVNPTHKLYIETFS